jgi:hypothetical protein
VSITPNSCKSMFRGGSVLHVVRVVVTLPCCGSKTQCCCGSSTAIGFNHRGRCFTLITEITRGVDVLATAKRRWAHAVCKRPSEPRPPFPRRSWRGHGAAVGINLPRRIASSVAVPRSRDRQARCYWTASAAAERCHWSDSRW